MITLKFLRGYWTVCVRGKPLVSFESRARALEMVPEAVVLNKKAAA